MTRPLAPCTENLVKLLHVVLEICAQADTQTDIVQVYSTFIIARIALRVRQTIFSVIYTSRAYATMSESVCL